MVGSSSGGKKVLSRGGQTGTDPHGGGPTDTTLKPKLPTAGASSYPRVVMESLLAKAEWWLERNRQEIPFMGEERLRKEGENKVLSWMIENLRKELRD